MDFLLLVILLTSIGFLIYLIIKNNSITKEYEKKISDLKANFEVDKKKTSERAVNASRNSIKGSISEIFCPFHQGFPYKASDCTFLGKPIDFIIFNNLEEFRDGEKNIEDVEVVFVEVKSNLKASLSKVQSAIKKAVDEGRVRFETYKYDAETIKNSQIGLEIMNNNDKTLKIMDFSSLDKEESWQDPKKSKIIKARLTSPRAYRKWFTQEEDLLISKVDEGYNLTDLSILFGRECSALENKLKSLSIDVKDL